MFVGVANQPDQVAAIGVAIGKGGAYAATSGTRQEHYFMSLINVESTLNVSVATQ